MEHCNVILILSLIIIFYMFYNTIYNKENIFHEHFENSDHAPGSLGDIIRNVSKTQPTQMDNKLYGRGKFCHADNDDAAPVDGNPKSPRSAAVFTYNRSSPECCFGVNGGYSTSSGCVCVTPEQEKWFGK